VNSDPARQAALRQLRRGTFLFPPWGLYLLWTGSRFGMVGKLFGTVFIAGVSLIYTALIGAALVRMEWLKVEWRGGYVPAFTRTPTLPDYDALERHRGQTAGTSSTNAAGASARGAAYWTAFRGPDGDGHYRERSLRTNWAEVRPRVMWKQPVGGGYASFIVVHGLAITLEQRRKEEVVAAYDLETGRQVWAHAYYGLFTESLGGEGPRATPAYADGHVFALGGLGTLKCLSVTQGQERWSTNILLDAHAQLPFYGCAASPLVVGDAVVVAAGGPRQSSFVAYHRQSSTKLWQTLEDEAAYSTPVLARIAGRSQILAATKDRVVGLDPERGTLIWSHSWVVKMGNRNIAQPVVVGDKRVFLSASYGTGCEMIEIGTQPDGSWVARTLWKNLSMKNKFTSSVLIDGTLYGLDEDRLACVDVETGERRWKGERYGYGQILAAGRHVIILCGNGDVAFIEVSPEAPRELLRMEALRGKTWNQHAMADGRLLIRNAVEMACIDLR